ncbi:hypothetical protein [Nonomuraea angiospora]|uniref:hypothetical protein n=1 Tax=Nonomuraea angiospora TaxID=46172 RepID=UPI0029A800CA|nr:hypothetical protein [Nonomuraea angiospora]MDX3110156.1 hypothetical protein [Nonomuraea angiospora]
MANPPPVHLPGRWADKGSLLTWRINADGAKEYYVEWVPITEGPRGGLQKPRTEWLPASEVEQIEGQDYSQVPRTD